MDGLREQLLAGAGLADDHDVAVGLAVLFRHGHQLAHLLAGKEDVVEGVFGVEAAVGELPANDVAGILDLLDRLEQDDRRAAGGIVGRDGDVVERQLFVAVVDEHVAGGLVLAKGPVELGVVEIVRQQGADQLIARLRQDIAALTVDFLDDALPVDQDGAFPRAIENGGQLFLGEDVATEVVVDQHGALESVEQRLKAGFDQVGVETSRLSPVVGDGVADHDVGPPLADAVHLRLEGRFLPQFEGSVGASEHVAHRRDQVDQRFEAGDGDPRRLRRLLVDVGEGALHRGFDLDHLDAEFLSDEARGAAAADEDLGALCHGLASCPDPLLQISEIDLRRVTRRFNDALGGDADALVRRNECDDHVFLPLASMGVPRRKGKMSPLRTAPAAQETFSNRQPASPSSQ